MMVGPCMPRFRIFLGESLISIILSGTYSIHRKGYRRRSPATWCRIHYLDAIGLCRHQITGWNRNTELSGIHKYRGTRRPIP